MSFEGTFDVVIEGAGAERGAKVLTAPEGLYVAHHEVPYATLLGVALRGSILLVVGTQVAMALRGARDGLATLAAELRGHADLNHLPLEDRESLSGERVVFATPVAVSGSVDMERLKGMPLAVVTDAALHILERAGRQFRLPWERFSKVDIARAKFGKVLRVGAGTAQLEFLYLTDAQIQTIRGMAARHSGSFLGVSESPTTTPTSTPAPPDAGVGATADTGEGVGAADVSRHFAIPEFELSLGAVGSRTDRPLGATVERLQLSPVLPVGFLEEHLRELRTLYEGALVKRKREAAAAPDLVAAATALDPRLLVDEVRESFAVMADVTVRSFERQARRIAANRRIPWRKARKKYMPGKREIANVQNRLGRGIADLEKAVGAIAEATDAVKSSAPRPSLDDAYRGWLGALRELDQAYALGWTGLSREVVRLWQDAFIPKLTKLGGERRRLLPRPLRAAFYFLVFALVGAIVYLVATGQLTSFIEFQ